jgi:hypothetical protein
MRRTLLSLMFGSLMAMMCTSCATIIHGSRQKVNVYSDPPGARVYVNGVNKAITTPGHVSIKRGGSQHIRFEKDGYEGKVYMLTPRFNALVIVDFVMYLIPGVIDLAVGAHHLYDKNVTVDLRPLDQVQPKAVPQTVIVAERGYSFKRLSDVDTNIPSGSVPDNAHRYALIIGNEDYSTHSKDLNAEANVLFARNDASAFNEYAQKVLGIPVRNITMSLDATSAEMREGLMKLNLIAKNTEGNAEFFVFYAGHGLPDEETKEPYLIPVDVSGKFIKLGIPLSEFYQSLSEFPTKKTTVFLDACFSGGARSQGLVASRGIRVTPKSGLLKGNVVVFSASSGEESALPYMNKQHGLFTYYLLQKLQESRGNLNYKDLSDFMTQKIPLESVIINSKEQHPTTNVSADVTDLWSEWTLNELR